MNARSAVSLVLLLFVIVACQAQEDSEAASAAEAPDASNAAAGALQLTWTLPDGWINETPSSQMRIGQVRIPGAAGDGELAIFFFGEGSGGTLEDNLQRWTGMVETRPGEQARRHGFESAGLKITWMEVAGTIKASGFGMGPSKDQPDSQLYGAVIEGPGGPWFFKATGPEETLTPVRQQFIELLESLRLSADPVEV